MLNLYKLVTQIILDFKSKGKLILQLTGLEF